MADVKKLREALCLTESGYNRAIGPIAETASRHRGEFIAFCNDVLDVKTLDELVIQDGDSTRRLLRDLVLIGIARVNMRVLGQRLDEAEASEATSQ